jgi:ribonuclease HI
MKYIIYTDGASFGNPGPAGAGIAIYKAGDSNKELYKEYAFPLGKLTNNQAEYSALVLALKKIKQLVGKSNIKQATIEVRSDSELLVNQLNHRYKILDSKVKELFFDAWNLLVDFGEVTFHAIPREKNTHADALSKKAASMNS